MRIVTEGQNPYIKQARCSTCRTVVEVDIRTDDCKREETRTREWDSTDPDGRTKDEEWTRVIVNYTCPCPICSETIQVHSEWDDSDRQVQRRRRRGY